MKIIDTSVTQAGRKLPFYANRNDSDSPLTGLDFVQAAILDTGNALSKAVTSNSGVLGGTTAMILWGCVVSVVSSNYVISAGAVYFNGEIFYCPGNTAGASSSTYIHASWFPNPTDGSPNQTIMSDGTPESVHNLRTVTFTANNTNTPGNLPDFSVSSAINWVYTDIVDNTTSIAALNPPAWINLIGVVTGSYTSGFSNGSPVPQFRIGIEAVTGVHFIEFKGTIVLPGLSYSANSATKVVNNFGISATKPVFGGTAYVSTSFLTSGAAWQSLVFFFNNSDSSLYMVAGSEGITGGGGATICLDGIKVYYY